MRRGKVHRHVALVAAEGDAPVEVQARTPAASGFSLYPEDLVEAVKADEPRREAVFLAPGHDVAAAAALRAEGWRTVAALSDADDPASLGCSHRLEGGAARPL